MQKNYWQDHWERNDIAFHRYTFNTLLIEYWPELNLNPPAHVFVPLCGKSLDLLWFAQHGYNVTGVEFCEIACRDFFRENQLNYERKDVGPFTCYYTDRIQIYCGDFFALPTISLPPIDAVYDRASLIALPPDLRQLYAKQLAEMIPAKSQMLLISMDTPDNIINPPPFPVSTTEITQLYSAHFKIQKLMTSSADTNLAPHTIAKGYRTVWESVYLLIRHT